MDPKLPPELEELVIDHCQDDKATFLACSLVCKAWLAKARPTVFSSPQKLSDSTIASFHALIHSPHCTIIPLLQRMIFLPVFDIKTDFPGFLDALERLVVHVQSSGGNSKEISTGMVFPKDLIARPKILQHLSRSLTSFSCIILITTDAPPLIEVLSALAKTLETVNLFIAQHGLLFPIRPHHPYPKNVCMPQLRNLTLSCPWASILPWFLIPGMVDFPRLTYLSLWLDNLVIGQDLVQEFLDHLCAKTVKELVFRFRYCNLPALDLGQFASLRSATFKWVGTFDERSIGAYENIVDIVSTTPGSAWKLSVFVTDPDFELPSSAHRLDHRVEWIIGRHGDRGIFEEMVDMYGSTCGKE